MAVLWFLYIILLNWYIILIAKVDQGFPLDKAIAYVDVQKPYCVNDLTMQKLLLDRRCVLRVLDGIGIETPFRLLSQRHDVPNLSPLMISKMKQTANADLSPSQFPFGVVQQIDLDTIEKDGVKMKKPFVEKPISGEDHNIIIYYPQSQGGGARRLFRKIGNKSSDFDATCNYIRTDASYIYEEFVHVDNAEDVKIYTIGPSFHHCETRKSPVVDGVVRRNSEGKEVR